ncbi:transmembrane inner ear expressed protein [Diachasma alloeum]|uniref:transmembrane inner ear expressed protein n=1 Tax=Diachasma alloeum TaxID=454923 RepID=UPI0010FBBC07|nr:transmembrane inner ear expressed protein [Diachasma alloeum]
MDSTTVSQTIPDPSTPPCSPEEVAANIRDCGEGEVEKWLEDEALGGFRVWQLAAVVISIFLTLVIGLCCCIRFRVPRTKQNIEADYVRKKLTKNFRRELSKISNGEMDEMDLRKALEKVQSSLDVQEDDQEPVTIDKSPKHLTCALSLMFHRMRTRLSKTPEPHTVI